MLFHSSLLFVCVIFVDLLTKKWEAKKDDFKHAASIKSVSQGVTITSTVTAQDSSINKLAAKVNVKYADKSFGETTGEFATDGAFKGTAKFDKLKKGVIVSGEAECQTGSKIPTGKATVEYTTEPVAVSAEYNDKKNNFVASAAVGFEGLSAGVCATVDTKTVGSESAKDAVSVEAGLQYEDGNLVGTFQIEKTYKVSVSLYHRVSSALQLGSKVVIDSTKTDDNSLTVGAQYKVNEVTNVKGKAEIRGNNAYVLSSFVEHRLSNPNVVVGLSSQWTSVNKSADAFGVNLAFGEI